MRPAFRFFITVISLPSMANLTYADSNSDTAGARQVGAILEAGEIDSSTVEVGVFGVVIHGRGERHPVSGEWERLETARGYIQAVNAETLTLARGGDGWLQRIALDRIQTLVLAGSASREPSAPESSQKENIPTPTNSGRADAMPDTIIVKTDAKGETSRRIKVKLFTGIVGGSVFLWAGALAGWGIDDYYGKCRGLFPTNEQHVSEDDHCVDIGVLVGGSTGWVFGAPIGVSMVEPNDRFIHTLGGSLGGVIACGLLTLVSDGKLAPSLIVAPIVFSTVASEWSRNGELSPKSLEDPDQDYRFSLGIMPISEGNFAMVLTHRF